MIKSLIKKSLLCILILIIIVVLGYITIPKPRILSNFTYSSVIYDKNNNLLRLTLSKDDKYRLFVPIKDIPEDFKKALILYEDKRFYHHLGVDPIGLFRALYNMAKGGRKQGASTITMQLSRLCFNIDSTTISGKIYQIFKAIQIEKFYSKDEILESYFNLSPYGDNIEGIGSASIIYFGRDIKKVTLPEILALSVIPQNPENRKPTTTNGFLNMMEAQKKLSQMWIDKYSNDENNAYLKLPIKVKSKKDLPFLAPHFTTSILQKYSGSIKTTLDINLQNKIEEIMQSYVKRNKFKGVNNASALLINHQTMEVVSQIGSVDFFNEKILGQVDGTSAKRSPGSAMKPFIYALALEQGKIHPLTILKDLPKSYSFYNPENFDNRYLGIVTATSALVLSRNIPAVELLQQINPSSLYKLLINSNVTRLKDENFYGLSLALGGFEISMQEIAQMYAMLANHGEWQKIKVLKDKEEGKSKQLISPEASFLTLDMLSYNSPVNNQKLSTPVHWKTGTSYSYKDALSVGVFGPYVLVVWIGNFDGTPNHSFVGRTMAAPLFFEIIKTLEKNIEKKEYLSSNGLNIKKVDICKPTGDIANIYCPQTIKSWFIPGISPIKLSNIHREIPIDVQSGLRACKHTPPTTKLKVFEFWPSDIMSAFNAAGIYKKAPPDFMSECKDGYYKNINGNPPTIIYPIDNISYMIRPYKLNEEKIILKANADADVKEIFWFMNDALLGKTMPNQDLVIDAKVGVFTIKAVDDLGRSSVKKINIKLSN